MLNLNNSKLISQREELTTLTQEGDVREHLAKSLIAEFLILSFLASIIF